MQVAVTHPKNMFPNSSCNETHKKQKYFRVNRLCCNRILHSELSCGPEFSSVLICDCFSHFKPFLEKYLKLQDTCGVHNLHAMPGMLGGFIGAIVAAAATESVYSKEGWVKDMHLTSLSGKLTWTCLLCLLHSEWKGLFKCCVHLTWTVIAFIFKDFCRFSVTSDQLRVTYFFLPRLINVFDFEGDFANRSVGTQGGYQAAGTCVAIAFGLVGGAIVGESQDYTVQRLFYTKLTG